MKLKNILLMLSIFALGCGDPAGSTNNDDENNTDNNGGNNNGGNNNDNNGEASVSPEACKNACSDKGVACGAPAAGVAEACANLCKLNITPTQLNCLNSQSCADLNAAFQSGMSVCGIENGNGGQNNGGGANACDTADGSLCQADPNAPDDQYKYCESSSYCDLRGSPVTGCLYKIQTGIGTCVSTCSVDDIGTQSSCGSGKTCKASDKDSGLGFRWPVCS